MTHKFCYKMIKRAILNNYKGGANLFSTPKGFTDDDLDDILAMVSKLYDGAISLFFYDNYVTISGDANGICDWEFTLIGREPF